MITTRYRFNTYLISIHFPIIFIFEFIDWVKRLGFELKCKSHTFDSNKIHFNCSIVHQEWNFLFFFKAEKHTKLINEMHCYCKLNEIVSKSILLQFKGKTNICRHSTPFLFDSVQRIDCLIVRWKGILTFSF